MFCLFIIFSVTKYRHIRTHRILKKTDLLPTALERNKKMNAFATLFHCFTFYFYFLRLRKFAALFLKLLSSFVVTSRPGANIKFYNRPIRFRKPEALRGPFDRKEGRGGRRGEEAHFLRHETCVSLLSPSLPGRSDPARRTRFLLSSPRNRLR